MSIRTEELNKVITRIKDGIKAECLKIATDPDPKAEDLTNFKNQLVHNLRRLNRYEKELEMMQ